MIGRRYLPLREPTAEKEPIKSTLVEVDSGCNADIATVADADRLRVTDGLDDNPNTMLQMPRCNDNKLLTVTPCLNWGERTKGCRK